MPLEANSQNLSCFYSLYWSHVREWLFYSVLGGPAVGISTLLSSSPLPLLLFVFKGSLCC